MRKSTAIVTGAATVLLPAAAALAFPFGSSWHMPADGVRAGAGGLYGLGSVTDWGVTCAHCHVGGAGTIGVTIAPTPAWQLVNNVEAYKPGQLYNITLTMTGEHKGLNQGNNNLTGMAFTVEDAAGAVKGVLGTDNGVSSASCPPTYPAQDPAGSTYVYGDCHGVLFVPHPNATSWTFSWTAPPAGGGQLTLYYGVVDGDANGKSSKDDDTKMGTIKLVEGS
jgi:hypothetical protein